MAATDIERLVVQLSADIRAYQNALNKAQGLTNKRAKAIESRWAQVNKNVAGSFKGLAGVFGAGITIAGAQQLIDASTRITNSLKVAGLEGEALSKVYDSLFLSAQRNAVPLESLVELYSRLSLVQKELNISGDDLLKFTDNIGVALRVSGKSASEASGALLQLSQALGGGVVRAEEFNSILEGALPIAQAAAVGIKEAGGSVAKLRQLVVAGKVSSEAFFKGFEAGASTLQDKVAGSVLTVSQSLIQLQNVLIDAAGKLDKATGASKLATEFLNSLAEALKYVAEQGPGFISSLQPVADFLNDLNARAQALGASMRELVVGPGPLKLTVNGANQDSEHGAGGVRGGTAVKPVSLADYKVPGTDKKAREDTYARETRQLQESIKAQQLELSLVGQTQFARDKATASMELENAAKRAGITLTDEQRTKNEQLAASYATAAEAVRQAETRYQAIQALQQEFGQIAIDSIQGLIDGTKSLNDVLADTLKRLAEMALQAAILGQGPLAGLFGGGGSGGAVGGIVGALFGGFRANGGPVQAGKSYTVGERGQERFVPGANGYILPNDAIRRTSAPGSTVVVQADMRDSSANAIAVLNQRMDRLERNLPAIIQQSTRQGRANQPFYAG